MHTNTYKLQFDYCSYLKSVEGGEKSEKQATEMVKDLAKYAKFACPSEVDFKEILDRSKILSYIDLLRKTGVGPSGQVNKLQVMIVAINWTLSKIPDTATSEEERQKVQSLLLCREKLQAVKKTLTREKVLY